MASSFEKLESIELLAVLAAFAGLAYVLYKYIFCPFVSTTGCGTSNPDNPANNNDASLGNGITVGQGATACSGLGCTGNLLSNYLESIKEDVAGI